MNPTLSTDESPPACGHPLAVDCTVTRQDQLERQTEVRGQIRQGEDHLCVLEGVMIAQSDLFFLHLRVKFLGQNTIVQQSVVTPLVDRHQAYLASQCLLLIHCQPPDHISAVIAKGQLVEVILLKFVSLLWKYFYNILPPLKSMRIICLHRNQKIDGSSS